MKNPQCWLRIRLGNQIVPSFSLQWKSDKSTKHYRNQMLCNQLALWRAGKKFMHAYERLRSDASTLHWNPPGVCKKILYFSNRGVCVCVRERKKDRHESNTSSVILKFAKKKKKIKKEQLGSMNMRNNLFENAPIPIQNQPLVLLFSSKHCHRNWLVFKHFRRFLFLFYWNLSLNLIIFFWKMTDY